jgi:hypothetical protein
MKFACNECCGLYAFNSAALARFNEIRAEQNKPLMQSNPSSFDDYNDECYNLRADPDYVRVIEEFDENKESVLDTCELDVLDITEHPNLHELFHQNKLDDVLELYNKSLMNSSSDDSESESDDEEEAPTSKSKYYWRGEGKNITKPAPQPKVVVGTPMILDMSYEQARGEIMQTKMTRRKALTYTSK